MKNKIVFFGTSKFAEIILAHLIQTQEVVCVVTQPDALVGRKKILTQPATKILALENNIPVLQPEKLKDESFVSTLTQFGADVFVVAAYGKIIPQIVLDIPSAGCVNVHGSILPKYRGASPIQQALANGETTTGITLIKMDAEMDHGPVIAIKEVAIEPDDTFITLESKLARAGCDALDTSLTAYIEGTLIPTQQDHSQATFVSLLSKDDAFVDPATQSAQEIYNHFRGYIQFPGTQFHLTHNTESIICVINDCKVDERSNIPPTILRIENKKLFLGTTQGALQILSLTPQSKSLMQATDFANGYQRFDGAYTTPHTKSQQ